MIRGRASTIAVSLLTRINVIILSTTVIVGVMALAVSVEVTETQQTDSLMRRAELVAALHADSLAEPVWELNDRMVQGMIDALQAGDPAIRSIMVFEPGKPTPLAETARAGSRGSSTTIEKPIMVRGPTERLERVGTVRLVYSLDEVHDATFRALAPVGGLLLLSLVAAITVISVALNSQVLRPLSRLTRATQELARGNYCARIDSERTDEIGLLTRNFNDMAVKVQDHTELLEQRVRERTEALTTLNDTLAERNRQLTDSINYAQLIQTSILPTRDLLGNVLGEHCIIWRPREVVSGDFYFCRETDDGIVIGVADCTGHGVPGAFMTMTASAVLNTIIDRLGATDPARVLEAVDREVRAALHQGDAPVDGSFDDNGLDMGLCYVAPAEGRVVFSGGRISLFTVSADGVTELRGDRESLGYRRGGDVPRFTNREVALTPGRAFYLGTDGLTDQSGGERGLSFGKGRLKAMLAEHWRLPLDQQQTLFERFLSEYQHGRVQRDDITLIGFRVREDRGRALQSSDRGALAAE